MKHFKDTVLQLHGEKVWHRIQEQMVSDDYKDSNCAGLAAYLLGLQDNSEYIDPADFMKEYSFAGGSLVAVSDIKGNIAGDTDIADICVFGSPEYPGHIALFLGLMDRTVYTFDQISGGNVGFSEYTAYNNFKRLDFPRGFYNLSN